MINFSDKIWKKPQILYSITPFQKWCCLWDNVEKCSADGQATDDNMAHAHGMVDT